ncbi:MAG: pyridoxine 5'-phosphate synthase [Flavobacteriales bacterium]|nr:pyridoxine 5'-phosphate synthase [Flavobacteriales bacterium]|tara:strand:- start:11714 stop:12418 length:705 start_codon:yes stop_codon:yes gene_type:complete
MVKLSVNVNKIATLRNARGNNIPDLINVTQSIISFGADSITIHPRPDERHITKKDVSSLSNIMPNNIEFNIEGFPSSSFLKMVLRLKPNQVTLVPDAPDVLTSLEGWNIIENKSILTSVVQELNNHGIRTSIFIHPNLEMVNAAREVNAARIELFTGTYAKSKHTIESYVKCSEFAHELGLGVNAGHDLDMQNLPFFVREIPYLDEVSIGHGLISESLFLGLEKTISCYKEILS